ncbi:P-loop containing nucleoside triphosphate hydrolase protein [Mycena leptocephala]|nr:P-loop containing nucleoside triphosphate hydrolase protein [Mycena leptocephala]
MLPSQPKIFHGRDAELSSILQLVSQRTPRIAILGAGGMGKTSLARAVIHHTEITERYNEHRFFVACDSAATQVELAALIGAHVGLKPGKDLTHPVIQYFSSSSKSLLILDNLETLWEPVESRGKIEEFLSLLTGVDNLALVITMRGAERPAKVAWTHPFLPLLKPLEQAAARQTFIDIADNRHDPNEVDKVLSLTDNLPLAISLIANLVDSEGCSHVLSRWEEEKTALISEGYDRTSNLDLSVSLSLSSPRLNPHSKDLLSLLSMLPDGLSDVELVQSKLPVDNILGCKLALIRTALAYSDEHKRLKVLVPIREYMQKIQPPGGHLIQPLRKHFQELLEFFMEYQGNQSSSSTVARVSSNYSNIQNVLQNELQRDHPDLTLASDALEHFEQFNDPDLKCNLYNILSTYYQIKGDMSSGTKFCAAAISLALSTGNTKRHCQGLCNLAWAQFYLGDYSAAQAHAIEARRLALISADLYREAQALKIEAICCFTLGNYIKAMSLCIRAKDLLGLCGMSHGSLDHGIMNTQAEVHRLKSEYVEARSILISILEETIIQDPQAYGWALLNVAEIDVLIGAPKDDVQRNCDRVRKILDIEGYVMGVIMCDTILADLHLREGNSLAAKTIFERCLKVTPESSQIQTYCLEWLGDASCWGDLDGMDSWTAVFLVHSLKRKEKLGIYKALRSFGDIFLSQNDEHTATSLFTVALEGFTEMDVHRSRAECMLRFGDISMGHSDPLKAVEFWERARPLFERSSQAKQVQNINERFAGISNDVLEQHRNNLARLAELNAPVGTIEELEDDLSDIEDLDKMDMGDEKELGLTVA